MSPCFISVVVKAQQPEKRKTKTKTKAKSPHVTGGAAGSVGRAHRLVPRRADKPPSVSAKYDDLSPTRLLFDGRCICSEPTGCRVDHQPVVICTTYGIVRALLAVVVVVQYGTPDKKPEL